MNEPKHKGVELSGAFQSLPSSLFAFERARFARALDETKTSMDRLLYSPYSINQQVSVKFLLQATNCKENPNYLLILITNCLFL